jgi:hypothetical protein
VRNLFEFPVQRKSKIELVRAVQDLENRGYECVCPIQPESTIHKTWIYKEKGLKQNDKRAYNRFNEVLEHTIYKTKMRKVEDI